MDEGQNVFFLARETNNIYQTEESVKMSSVHRIKNTTSNQQHSNKHNPPILY